MSSETNLQDSVDAALASDDVTVSRAKNLYRFFWKDHSVIVDNSIWSIEWHLHESTIQPKMYVNNRKISVDPLILAQLEEFSLDKAAMHKLQTA